MHMNHCRPSEVTKLKISDKQTRKHWISIIRILCYYQSVSVPEIVTSCYFTVRDSSPIVPFSIICIFRILNLVWGYSLHLKVEIASLLILFHFVHLEDGEASCFAITDENTEAIFGLLEEGPQEYGQQLTQHEIKEEQLHVPELVTSVFSLSVDVYSLYDFEGIAHCDYRKYWEQLSIQAVSNNRSSYLVFD